MSDHDISTTTTLIDEIGLTDADLARAYATSVERGGRLVRRRNRRRAAFGGLAAVALFAGGIGIIASISDDTSDVVVTPADGSAGDRVLAPTASTTTSPSVPTQVLLPDGWERAESGGVLALTNPVASPESTVDVGGGVALGGGGAQERGVAVASSGVGRDGRVSLEFACVRGGDHIDELRFRLDGGVLTVEATITAVGTGGCPDGGASVDVTLPEFEITPATVVVGGVLDA